MKYRNSNSRKVRGSFIMMVSCAFCQTDIAKYQKVGRGNLLNMHIDRILESAFDFTQENAGLFCPKCREQLGARVSLNGGEKVYKMTRGTFHTRRENF